MKKAIIMIGIQGSGKSTCVEEYISDEYKRVSMDVLKTRNKERLTFERYVSEGSNIVIDNTNPTKKDRARYIDILQANGYVIYGYYMQSIVRDCVERNNRRSFDKRVPGKAIAATSNKLEIPTYDEGFDKLYYVMIDGNKMIFKDWEA